MAVTERVIAAPPEQVFAILADGWTYADWVVGTTHIRDVDREFPAPGSRIHHKVGPWPVSLRDETTVLRSEPPHRLVLRPKLRPFGELTASITLTPDGDGRTKVTMHEDTAAGPLHWLRTKANDLLMHGRNRETLRRLADMAEHRADT
jgi:uncharacterized protein YndB with AHSA1/START domain